MQDYILSRPDKFSVVKDSLGSELVNVEVSEKSKHIVKFVTLQRPTLSGKPSAFSASKFYNDQRNREPSRIFRLPDDPLDNYVHPSERLAARHSPSRVKPPRRLTVHAKAEEPVKRPQSPTGKNLIPHRDKDNTPPRRSR